MNKTKKSPNKGKSKKALIRNIAILFLSVVLLISGVGCVYADQMLGRINFVPLEDPVSKVETAPIFQEGTASGDTSAQAGVLGGLYHDDAITNILVMGVDDYQPNDPGRSDSMMLVSVDSRHKKLKLTSFMRDMYVAIPGHGSQRLNVAYASGGPQLSVSTIEANFGTDIDRFVLIDYASFSKIVDKLGGVTMTITSGEAKLINQNSGDSRRNLSAGTFLLSGKQALYYSRIRAIGDDFERTERQRKVFSSIVNKFKTASLGTINQALYDILPLVTTNMTKNEVLNMATNALTYLNYPVSQNRIPANNEYTSQRVSIGGSPADVLVPDLEKCQKTVANFIYESDLPSKTYQGK
ncbi:MAG: LCP family protein [bacterium]